MMTRIFGGHQHHFQGRRGCTTRFMMVELIVRTSKRSVNRTLEVHLQLREAVEKKENRKKEKG